MSVKPWNGGSYDVWTDKDINSQDAKVISDYFDDPYDLSKWGCTLDEAEYYLGKDAEKSAEIVVEKEDIGGREIQLTASRKPNRRLLI